MRVRAKVGVRAWAAGAALRIDLAIQIKGARAGALAFFIMTAPIIAGRFA